MMSDLVGMLITASIVAPGTYWLLSTFWKDCTVRRAEHSMLMAQTLDEFVAASLCGPDVETGRCRQCGVPVSDDTVIVHARLRHDLRRPHGPEDDQSFIRNLTRDSGQDS